MSGHPSREELRGLDGLDPVRRHAVLDHASGCPACTAALVQADPSRLFALLALDAVPAEALDRVERDVEGSLDRTTRPTGARWRAAAALAASVLLAGWFGHYVSDGEPPVRSAEAAGLVAEPTAPAPARSIELISTPGKAEVVDLAVGETRVVMIFDRELEL